MSELAPKPPREPAIETPGGEAARAIALCRLALFIPVTLLVLSAVVCGEDDSGGLIGAAMKVAAVFLGSFVAGLAGFVLSTVTGSHFFRRIDERMLRRIVLVSLLVPGGAFTLS